ncbi:MAG: transglutaminase domain-containing protein [Phycisphaerales bacterium]|nr:transglutaminase domain-containing protein [Phycisphaerales bacterium]
MNLARLQHVVGLLLVVLTIATYCLADANLALFVLAVPGAIAAWFLTSPPLGRPLPRIGINVLLLAILVYSLQRMLTAGFNVSNVCEIITLTLLVKIMDRRTQRDLGQIVSITAFLGIGTILTSNAFAVGVLLILCLVLLIAGTLLHQCALPAASTDGIVPTHAPAGPHAGRHLRRLVFSIAAAGMVISIFVFLFMPRRLGAGLFGQWGNPGVGQVTGFSDEVELGTPGFITPSATAVLDLQVFDPDGQSLGAEGIVYYLRGAVLDQYDSGRWTRSQPRAERDVQRARLDRSSAGMTIGSTPIRWNIEQRITIRNTGGARSHAFSIWRPVSIQVLQPSVVYAALDDGMLLFEIDGGKFSYVIRSRDVESPRAFARAGPPAIAEPVQAPNLNSRRFADLATQILTNVGLDPDPSTRPPEQITRAAEAIARYFDSGFVYTLEAELVPARRDPTEWFLFDHRAGHCEYYASAMAILCRAVGINARVITGYVATEFNEPAAHYIVRQSNAHAWVEVEYAEGAWQTFDPTPPADFQRVHEPSRSLFAQARRLFDAAEFAWIRTVVSFNADRQQTLLRAALNVNWTPDQAVEDFAYKLRRQEPRVLIQIVASVVMVCALLFLLVFLAWRYRQAILHHLSLFFHDLYLRLSPRNDARTVYLCLLAELRRRGLPKPAGVPLLTHVRSISARVDPEEALAAERLALALYQARFSPHAALATSRALHDLRVLRRAR